MHQLPLFSANCLTVSEINRMARRTLESDPELQDVWVGGEISGVSRPASGHVYFTLKDSSAALRCVMWRDIAARVILPKDGEAAEVHGHISLYETGGQYQLYVDYLQGAGQGELFAEFQRLKNALAAEGLFDPERKRAIPRWPRRVAVVTSPVGAAWRDVQTVFARRYPVCELLLSPTAVQGEDAPKQICRALRKADGERPDVVLLVRGGGSIEDLWAFNSESVVRAVAGMRSPVVSGVGHETDFTLVDFAADLRAPTPSAAAEMASPDRRELIQDLRQHERRMAVRMESVIRGRADLLHATGIRLRSVSPLHRLQNVRQQVDEISRRAESALRGRIAIQRTRVEGLARLLDGMGPVHVLDRGYALVWNAAEGRLVRSVEQAPPGTPLRIQMADGNLAARSEGPSDAPPGPHRAA
ncbi:MAG: exodeoxyribonuclease VII large subunit [Anaerolineales bacterium]